jgi:xylulokinase
VPPGSHGLTFHPYLNGERAPHWNPALRASFVGLTSAHGRGHLARAVMEGVAMSMREARGPDATQLGAATLIGGGARSAVWADIMAAVFRAELRVPEVADSSLGGALLAASHLGWLTGLAQTPDFLAVASSRHTPDEQAAGAYDRAFARYQRVQQALQPGYEADHEY